MSKNVLKGLKSLNLSHSGTKKEKNNYEVKKKNKKKKIFKGIKEFLPNMGNIFSQNRPHNVIENVDEYATNLMTKLTELRGDGIRCDVTLNNDKFMAAHKVVVSFNQKLLEMAIASSETTAVNIEEGGDIHKQSASSTNFVTPLEESEVSETRTPIQEKERETENTLQSADTKSDIEHDIEITEKETENVTVSAEENLTSTEENLCEKEKPIPAEENLSKEEESLSEEDSLVSQLKTEDVVLLINQEDEVQEKNAAVEQAEERHDDKENEEVELTEEVKEEDTNEDIPPPLSEELSLTAVKDGESEKNDEESEGNRCDDSPGSSQPILRNNPIEVLVHFLYTSHIDITQKNVTSLRIVAKQCDMEDVITACNEFDKVLETETEPMVTNEEKDIVASQFRYRYSDPTMPSKMLQHFEKLRDEKKFTDLKIKSPSKDIFLDTHSVVLASGSNFFQPVISTEQNEVEVTEIDESVLGPLIDFLYTGKVDVNDQSVSKLIQAADRMQLPDIIEGCAEFLESSLNVQNCIQHRSIGIDYKCHKLKDVSNAFIAQHFTNVILTPDFLTLSVGSLLEITTSNDLVLDFPLSNGEMAVFNAIKRWISYDEENRKQHLVEVMSAVRFALISEKHLLDDVTTDVMVMSNEDACDHVTSIISSKPYKCFNEPVFMRGHRCIITTGGSYPVADETSEERGYQAVTYSSQFTAFDVNTGVFHELTALPATRSLHCVVACDQYVFVVGGFDSYSCIVKTAYCFDLSSGKWSVLPNLKIKRACFSLHLISGFLYAIGGLTPKGYTGTVERLDRKRKSWELVKPLPCTRYRHAGCVLNEKIMVSGGYEKQDTVFIYNPNDDEWKKAMPLNVGRDSHVMQAVDDKAYAIGGDGIPFSTEVYNNSMWTTLYQLFLRPKKLYLPGVAVIDNKIFLFGGWSGEDEIVEGVRYYDTTVCEWKITDWSMPIPRGSSSSCTIRIPKNYWRVRFNTPKLDD